MIRILLLVICLVSSGTLAEEAVQTDWSGGGGGDDPVDDWGVGFEDGQDVSWLALPGELPLSSTPKTPVEHALGSPEGPRHIDVADVDGDGDADVLAAVEWDECICWYENEDGLGTNWDCHVIQFNYILASCVHAADIDGDGDTDVLGTSANNQEINWWSNDDGMGTEWTGYLIKGGFWGASTVHTADLDGDGDLDIMGGAVTVDDLIWWENEDGTGTVLTEHMIDDSYWNPHSVRAADIDDDGALEVLGCAHSANRIDWWEVEELAPVGVLRSSILDTHASEVDWGELIWDADVPDGAFLTVEVRAGDDFANLGDWMTVAASHDEIPAVLDDSRYFQYRLTLEPSSTNESPLFDEIELFFESDVGLDGIELSASPENNGVLLGWTVEGDVPASVRVLRGAENPVAVSGSLPGTTRRWLDRGVTPGESYVYWLEVTEDDGSLRRCGPTEAVVVTEAAQRLSLAVPYPSPATDSLTLSYSLPEGCSSARLTIYDISGRRIFMQLIDAVPGRHPLVLDVAGYPQGVYIARIAGEGASATRRFVISR